MASFSRFLGSFSWRIGFCSFKQSFQISLSSQHSFVDSEPASDYHIMSTNEEASRCKLDAIKLGYWKDPFLARFVHTSMSHEKKSPISVWLLPAWLISNTFWTMSLSMSRLLTMFRNSFVMRRAGFRSREINYERSQNDWQKGKQTGLRNCAQPGNCPVQPAHETWPARIRWAFSCVNKILQLCTGKQAAPPCPK